MEQERNPNKNAELSIEQNNNQIDGIINTLPAPLPEDTPLDKVREHPPKRRSREREERCQRSASAVSPSMYGYGLTSWRSFGSAWPRRASAT